MPSLVTAFGAAIRRLARSPAFALFSIVTLAVGIGTTVAFYAVTNSLFTPPLVVADSHRLFTVTAASPSGALRPALMSWPDIMDIATETGTLAQVGGFARLGSALTGSGTSATVNVEAVSGNYFGLLSVGVARGRPIVPSDDRLDAQAVIVLSHRTWRSQFGSDPTIVGRTVALAGHPVEVVGVASADFQGVGAAIYQVPAAWVPLSVTTRMARGDRAVVDTSRRRVRAFTLVMRLAPEVTGARVTPILSGLADRLNQLDASSVPVAVPPSPQTSTPFVRRWQVLSLADAITTVDTGREVRVILALPLLVLLVACTNLANLVVSRGVVRRYDLAVRAALGASRRQLVLEELAEPVVIAVCGGLLGMAIANALLVGAASALQAPVAAALGGMRLDLLTGPSTWVVAAAATTMAVVVFGVMPALRLTGQGISALISADNAITGPRWRGRRNLIALQVFASVAVSLCALAGYTYVDRGLGGGRVPPASLQELALAAVPLDGLHGSPAVERHLAQQLAATVAVASHPPFAMPWGEGPDASISVAEDHSAKLRAVGGDYFRTLNYRLISGRVFDARDGASGAQVVVVNERLAHDLFGSTDVVGRTFAWEQSRLTVSAPPSGSATIVGVVAAWDVDQAVAYAPLEQRHQPMLVAFSRGSVDQLRASIRQVSPDIALWVSGRADVVAGGPRSVVRFIIMMVGMLAAVVLVLSMSGLYGVLSQVVAQRRCEMGLRVALGASTRDIVWLVVRSGLTPVIEGCVIAVGVTTTLLMLLRNTYGDQVSLPTLLMLAAVIVPLVLLAVATCYAPARRAAQASPNVVLRDQ